MHKVTVIESVIRTYMVEDADGSEQSAKDRLHLFFRDPELLREGVVKIEPGEKVQSRRIKDTRKVGGGEGGPKLDKPVETK